jgi:hypothetical protein
MAIAHTAVTAMHRTLTANAVEQVQLTGGRDSVEVKNRSASGDIYFTVGSSVPTIGGDDCYIVQPGESLVVPSGFNPSTVIVSLICVSANAYSVTGV